MNLSQNIEAILFSKAEPVSLEQLCKYLKINKEDIEKGLIQLENDLKERGICLLRSADDVALGTSKETSELINSIRREELTKDLGKAGLETLSIILYEGPISRTEVDYIRGVNSQFIIRNLLLRGLIDRVASDKDARIFLYKPTMELLAHLGVNKIADIPNYQEVRDDIKHFKENKIDSHVQS